MDLHINGYCFILLALFCVSCQPEEQPATSAKKTELELYRAKFEEHYEKRPDSTIYYLRQREALINNDTNSLAGCQLAFDYGRYYFTKGDYGAAIDHNAKAIRIAGNMGDSMNLAKSLNMLGNVQHKLGNYARALDHFYRSLNIRKQTGHHSSTSIPLTNIGLVYKDMGEYDKAGKAFTECLEIDKQWKDTFGLALDYNHLGIIFKKKERYKEARENFSQSLKLAEKLRDTFQKAIVLNNLGLVEAEIGNYRLAIEYLEEALSVKRELKMDPEIATTANYLAEVYLKNGDFVQALNTSREALEISIQAGAKEEISKAYHTLSGLSEARGDLKKALSYHKSFKTYEDSMLNETRTRQIAEMETIYDNDKKEKQIARLTIARQEEALKHIRYVTILTVILFLITGFGLAMHYRNRKNRQITEAKIKSYEQELDSFMQNLLEKNQRIEKLNADLAKARDEIFNSCPSHTNHMDNLMQSPILTDDDWTRFKKLFLQAYPGFFMKLRQKFPEITQTEERLIALTKLNLQTKEIASMLGISAESVNKSRYRMRKKHGVSSEEIATLVLEV